MKRARWSFFWFDERTVLRTIRKRLKEENRQSAEVRARYTRLGYLTILLKVQN